MKRKTLSFNLTGACWLFAILFFAGSCARAQSYTPGQSFFGRSNYVEYIAGDMPVIISAPHGGILRPAELPDRKQGVFSHDSHTEELARTMQEVFHREFHHYPHVIICRLERVKLDCNRELGEGAGDSPLAKQAWHEYQQFLGLAEKSVLAKATRGFFLEMHGQAHPIKRLELGYALTAEELENPDQVLNQSRFASRSTIRALSERAHLPFSQLIRGPNSFGGLLLGQGYPSVPSPAMPNPGKGNPYFDGGYNVRQHTSVKGGLIDGLQIESNLAGVRDTAASRAKFSLALARSVEFVFTNYYRLDLRTGSAAHTAANN